MSSLGETILALAVGYAAIGALLLILVMYSRLGWPIKAAAIVLTSAFYVVDFFAVRGLMGWGAIDSLPANFKLLSARIVEPHSLAGDSGAIYLWVEALDEENFPSGAPRAYRLPFTARLAEKAEAAVKASAEGKPQGGHAADFGNGGGGTGEATPRETTPSRLNTTAGGDPSSGGAVDPSAAIGQTEGVVFTPLPPPRLPPKDAP